MAVRVSIPGPDSAETPVAGVGVVALPYDRDSVLRQLEARARTPRPDTAPLDSLFAAFRGPFTAYTAATLRLGKLRDSLAAAKARLDSRPRRASPHSAGSASAHRLGRGPSARRARSSTARGAISSAASDSLRRRIRQWEDSTYQGYDSIVQGAGPAGAGREAVTDTTGPRAGPT